MVFRKAIKEDLQIISKIYAAIHMAEECDKITTGWIRNVYPTDATAEEALQRDDLFVGIDDNLVVGAAIINKQQSDAYRNGHWSYMVSEQEIMVLHTLVIDPMHSGKGYGKSFVRFYERYAISQGCHYLRMDTQAKNNNARAMYKKLGYKEIDIVPCTFNGIKDVQLVLLEKKLLD
ncbi:MAG: GNAT family N-acetyltransferase [Lachnospiraceae bacterium]|nr:GNAT family N-acetyltransferase [Lachnospiraceae bacterium]